MAVTQGKPRLSFPTVFPANDHFTCTWLLGIAQK